MQVDNNTVISLLYQLKDDQGNLLESSQDNENPLIYLHGHRQMIRGFEKQMQGAEVGEKRTFEVMPAEGYGLRNIERIERVPAKYLKHEGKLTPGKVVRVNTDKGVIPGTVIKVGRFSVDVDMNHPFAGKVLSFETEVLNVRAATAEEISHGHVHGEGGCSHDN